MAEEKTYSKFFWIDLEMTGLDAEADRILEVAAVVTDLALEPLARYHAVVRQPAKVLKGMDAWCTKTHGQSGLSAEVLEGTPLKTVEKQLVAFARRHFGKQKIVLCGNSVSQDRRFVDLYLKSFAKMLHYRLLDVTAFKEVYRNRYGIKFEKKDSHRAQADIYESIAELRHYLSFVSAPRRT